MKNFPSATLAICFCFSLGTTACVQLPTEKSSVVDMRPQISFQLTQPAEPSDLEGIRVFVDNLPVGSVAGYMQGKGALRVLPGSHIIRIEIPGRPPVEERIYIGDGVAKTILVTR